MLILPQIDTWAVYIEILKTFNILNKLSIICFHKGLLRFLYPNILVRARTPIGYSGNFEKSFKDFPLFKPSSKSKMTVARMIPKMTRTKAEMTLSIAMKTKSPLDPQSDLGLAFHFKRM